MISMLRVYFFLLLLQLAFSIVNEMKELFYQSVVLEAKQFTDDPVLPRTKMV